MPLPFSKTQVDRLGNRLRAANPPAPADLADLQRFVEAHHAAREEVTTALRDLGYQATSRLKTWSTIVDKLRRESARLSQIQDIAGARLTVEDIIQQNDVIETLTQRWPGGRSSDRRTNPSHGYRAFHLIVPTRGCFVEIQVRTRWQNLWAQALEKSADRFGRGIRYGEIPEDAPEAVAPMVTAMIDLSQAIDEYETIEWALHVLTTSGVEPDYRLDDGQKVGDVAEQLRTRHEALKRALNQIEEYVLRLAE